ncbi:hypothetical protein M8J75_010286 [Diaphorina citri]|nr:hypothetical protein M8J75_010286 [Diaphorina citri]
MTSLICRRYLNLHRSWSLHRTFTKDFKSTISCTPHLLKTSNSYLLSCQQSYHLNPIPCTVSFTLRHSFSTKHQEDVTTNAEPHAKVKLSEGDVALVMKETDIGEHLVGRYKPDDVERVYNYIASIYPGNSARGYLHNYVQMYKSLSGKDIALKYHFSRCAAPGTTTAAPGGKKKKKKPQDSHWSCVVRLKEPMNVEIRAVGQTKADAGDIVAKLMLSELHEQRLVNSRGKPVLSREDRKTSASPGKDTAPLAPIDTIGDLHEAYSTLDGLHEVAGQYENDILSLISSFEDKDRELREAEKLAEETKALERTPVPVDEDFMRQIERFSNPVNARAEERRNQQLAQQAQVLMEKANRTLQDIVDSVSGNQITIIKGEPGCGKSTQVAQMLLNEASVQGNGSGCNILITQPRRISAISLAKRVASERNEMVGESVGYHVRLQHMFPRHRGHIQFITTGILLSRLQTQQGLDSVSHIILDEAHERDISTDLLLLLTKRLLTERPDLRLIVMSATMNAEMFHRYYASAPVLHIPGFTHPVERNYLSLANCKLWNLCSKEEDMQNLISSKEPTTNTQIISNLIRWIHVNKPEGAILCFLPGWQDIIQVSRVLSAIPGLLVTMAHSKLDTEVQGAIFGHPPPGMRKVVLSTNVAETSITIDDVAYVVDTGCHKETRYNSKDDLVSLDNQWISRASVNQRAGRAGRTKPGESFHLYSEDRMAEYSLPEIFRKPLEQILLTCKLYSTERCSSFLSQLPEPPDPASITSAATELKLMGVFDQEENLTPLGKRIAAMPCHPKLSKALVESVIYKCVLPMGNIVTMLSTPERPLFENSMLNTSKEIIRDIKSNLSRYSDHIASSKILNDWGIGFEERLGSNPALGNLSDYLHQKNLRHLYSVRDQLMNTLYANRLLDDNTDWAAINKGNRALIQTHNINKMSHVDEWVRGVLYSGLQNLIVAREFRGKRRLCTEQGQTCTIVKESVNSGLKVATLPLLTYYDATTSLQRRLTSIRDASVISPLSLLLFRRGTASLLYPKRNRYLPISGKLSSDPAATRSLQRCLTSIRIASVISPLSLLLFRRGTATLLYPAEAVRIKPDLNENECIVALRNENKKYHIVVADQSQAQLLLQMRAILARLSAFFIAHTGHPSSTHSPEVWVRLENYWDRVLDGLTPLFQFYSSKIDETRNEKMREEDEEERRRR